MKANSICKELEDNYISLFQKVGCDVKLDDEGIHASTSINNLYMMDDIFAFLRDCHVGHSVHIDPTKIHVDIRERYFEEDKK